MPNIEDADEKTLREGARRAALLLSVLDSDTVEELLKLFEPKVVDVIVDEAARVKSEHISYDEVESIVNDFLSSFGVSDCEFASALLGEAKRTVGERLKNETNSSLGKNSFAEHPPVLALEAFEPIRLLQALEGERPTIVAGILSLVTPKFYKQVADQYVADASKTIRGQDFAIVESSLSYLTPTSVMKRLESAFFERMLEQ